MPDDAPQFLPADRAELLHSLSYALRCGRTASRQERDDLIARLAAEQVRAVLERNQGHSVLTQRPRLSLRIVSKALYEPNASVGMLCSFVAKKLELNGPGFPGQSGSFGSLAP